MKIIISGTPGTGKTCIAEKLAKELKFACVSANDFAEERGLFESRDKKTGSIIVDEKKLAKAFDKVRESVVLEGHLAHFCAADIVIVLRVEPKSLEERLRKRGWSDEKVRENVEAEMVGVCLSEALGVKANHGKVFEIDVTGKRVEESAEMIRKLLSKPNDFLPGRVDWLKVRK